jgi:hypothetical protein
MRGTNKVTRAFLGVLLLAGPLLASATPPVAGERRAPQPGDCVILREGGSGWLLKAPTYWLRGTIDRLVHERRTAGVCPQLDKPVGAYTRADHARVAAAMPCVTSAADAGEVDVLRVHVLVDSWETPWSHQGRPPGWLFRGQFLDQTLHKGMVIDMDAGWLEFCEERS